jgi:hypothetical protein
MTYTMTDEDALKEVAEKAQQMGMTVQEAIVADRGEPVTFPSVSGLIAITNRETWKSLKGRAAEDERTVDVFVNRLLTYVCENAGWSTSTFRVDDDLMEALRGIEHLTGIGIHDQIIGAVWGWIKSQPGYAGDK